MAHKVIFVNGKATDAPEDDKPKNGTEDPKDSGFLQRIIRKLKHEANIEDKKGP